MKKDYDPMDFSTEDALTWAISLSVIALVLASISAWGTSVVNACLHHEWLLLLVDFIAFPAGIIHGVGVWFGVW